MVYLKGQIRKALSGFYYVYADGETYQTRARGNFRNRKITPLVGDEVLFESDNLTDGYVLEILPRRNELVRPPVANVDLGVVVMSMVSPNFSFNLLDRFLVSLEYKDIEPVIYLTKVDLLDEPQRQEVTEIKQIYEALGYAVIALEDVEAHQRIRTLFPRTVDCFYGTIRRWKINIVESNFTRITTSNCGNFPIFRTGQTYDPSRGIDSVIRRFGR